MSSDVHQLSQLADSQWLPFTASAKAKSFLRIVETPLPQILSLRGDAGDAAFSNVARDCLGLVLPVVPNTYTQGDACLAMWMGPDEWQLQSLDAYGSPARPAELAKALEGVFASVVDVSSGYTVIALEGERAAEVLGKGCPLDMHPRYFGLGRCAQTRFFEAAVVLRRTDSGISLTTRRSFAPYVAELLVDAAGEFA